MSTSFALRVAGAVAVVAASVLAVTAVVAVRDRDAAVAAYVSRLRTLETENQRLSVEMRGLLEEAQAAESRLEESYAPVEVGGHLDLPIQRAFARRGDTLSSVSRREGVPVDVLRALNPWLPAPGDDGTVPLQDRQSLWVPKPGRE